MYLKESCRNKRIFWRFFYKNNIFLIYKYFQFDSLAILINKKRKFLLFI